MKYTKLTFLLGSVSLLLAGCGNKANSGPTFWSVLLVILSLALLALAGLRTYSIIEYNRRPSRNGRRRRPRKIDPMTIGMFALAVLLLFGSMLGSCGKETVPDTTEDTTPPTETEDIAPISTINPVRTALTDPANWGIRW